VHFVVIANLLQLQYIGCYKDGGIYDRVLTGSRNDNDLMTVDMCRQFCQQSGETYFGLEVWVFYKRIDHNAPVDPKAHDLNDQVLCSQDVRSPTKLRFKAINAH